MSPQRTFAHRVALFGVLAFGVSLCLAPSQFPKTELFLLMILSLYGEWRSVKLPGYGFLNPGEGFYMATACLFGPAPGGILALLMGLVGDFRKRKSGAVLLFNVGWSLATFGLVGLVYHYAGWLGAGITYLVVAGGLQAVGEREFAGLSLSQTLSRQMKEMLLLAPAVFGFCYLLVVLLNLNTLACLSLVLPLELVVAYVRTRELSRELGEALRELELAQAELVATGRQAALGVMAAGISHEINNPLAAAMTNLHMLKMMTPSTATPALSLLEKSLERCRSVVARMLKYSRKPAAGGVACELEELFEDAVLFCGRTFGSGGVRLEVEWAGVPKVLGDPTELVQILSNLLANAHDAGGDLVEVGAVRQAHHLSVTVSDNGSGIPEELLSQIFEPFFTTKRVGSGTGLGLSIAQGLARGHGGELTVKESSPGRTVFELRLRLVESVTG